MIAHKSVAAASGEDWNQMFQDGGREGGRQEQRFWSGGGWVVCGGEQWGSAHHSGENTWLPSFPPSSPRQAPLFLQTGAAKLFTDSRIRLVRRDTQAQGGTWEVPRKATSWPEMCPCCPTGTSLLKAGHLPTLAETSVPRGVYSDQGKREGQNEEILGKENLIIKSLLLARQRDRLSSESKHFLHRNHVRCFCH